MQLKLGKLLKICIKSIREAPLYNVLGKEPAPLLKYEFRVRCFSKVLFGFPENLFFTTPLFGSKYF